MHAHTDKNNQTKAHTRGPTRAHKHTDMSMAKTQESLQAASTFRRATQPGQAEQRTTGARPTGRLPVSTKHRPTDGRTHGRRATGKPRLGPPYTNLLPTTPPLSLWPYAGKLETFRGRTHVLGRRGRKAKRM